MSSDDAKQILVEVNTGRRFGPIKGKMGDVPFPEEVRGWADVLDCRHGRYLDMGLQEIRHIAEHVHKHFVLVYEDRLSA